MSISKSEAIYLLALSVGVSDGDFSEIEVSHAVKIPVFHNAAKEFLSSNGYSKIKSGEINIYMAIEFLKKLTIKEQIEALAICWAIIVADKEISEEEKDQFIAIMKYFEIFDLDLIKEKYIEMMISGE